MSIWLRTGNDAMRVFRCLAAGAVFCALVVGVPSVLVASAPSSAGVLPNMVRRPVVLDVVLQPNGVLQGRIVAPDGRLAAHRNVALRHRGGVAAETASDAQGQFTLRNLTPGLYEVQVQTPQGLTRQLCRVWTAQAAPPLAACEVRMVLGEATIRGQIPFAPTGFSQVATVSALVAGAIAGPVIYENAKGDNRVPSSP